MGEPKLSLPGGRLETQLAEKKLPFDPGAAIAEAQRCLYCADAPCIQACPTSIDIPTFIRKIGTGNLRGSARTILSANLLGASCARVCPVEVLCEGACVFTAWEREPIQIGRLQRHAMEEGAHRVELRAAPACGKRVALVGSGPASLACAGTLALLGYEAVVLERQPLPGGLNATGVAPYKMPTNQVLDEVKFVQSLGVEIRCGVGVGVDVSVEALLDEYDAVFLAPGLGDDAPMDVPGADHACVQGAVAWIRRMKTDPDMSLNGVQRAVVVGGGNTAIDATRELAQLGVRDVRLVYRRRESDMRGYAHEWRAAQTEGVALVEEAIVTEVRPHSDTGVQLAMVRAASGRPTDESLDPLDADLVLVAIGQERLRSFVDRFPGVACDERGRIVVDVDGRTGNPSIYAGGDAVNGGKEVVNAVDEGQRAARAIHADLSGGASDG